VTGLGRETTNGVPLAPPDCVERDLADALELARWPRVAAARSPTALNGADPLDALTMAHLCVKTRRRRLNTNVSDRFGVLRDGHLGEVRCVEVGELHDGWAMYRSLSSGSLWLAPSIPDISLRPCAFWNASMLIQAVTA
jgi:hypothetical protein